MHHNVFNVRSAQCRLTAVQSFEGVESSLVLYQTFWISNPNTFDWLGYSSDQRCNVNMMLRSTSLTRGVMLNLIRDNTSLSILHWSAL